MFLRVVDYLLRNGSLILFPFFIEGVRFLKARVVINIFLSCRDFGLVIFRLRRLLRLCLLRRPERRPGSPRRGHHQTWRIGGSTTSAGRSSTSAPARLPRPHHFLGLSLAHLRARV